MTLSAITLKPGIDKMVSPSLNEGGYSAGNRVRFRRGLPEKMRGWTKRFPFALVGVVRAMMALYELIGDVLLTVGTHNHLYMIRGGTAYDITPIDRDVAVAANDMATVSGSTVVTVTTSGAHGLVAGDFFTFDAILGQVRTPATIAFNGISLGGRDFMVLSTLGGTVFTFEAPTAATATGPYSLASTLTIFMPAGPKDATPGLGWGAGGWGIVGWGLPATQAANLLPARMWSLESWGQMLLAVPTQGRLIYWLPDPSGSVTTRAAYVTNPTPGIGPPLIIGSMFVGMPERHVILLGCSDLDTKVNYDPMLVRFSDVEDYTSYQASATNSAGSFRLQFGSTIMGALNTTLQSLIWTDVSLWQMRFVGLPYVYSFAMIDRNAGLISQNARADLGGTNYWMGPGAFWAFRGGAPVQLPCSLHDFVFDGLNRSQATKVFCGTNSKFGEVIWYYPSRDLVNGVPNVENDKYVVYNTLENCWYGGDLARTAWLDRTALGDPLGSSPESYIFDHENGQDADGSPMGDFVESGFFDLEDGENLLFISGVIPDFTLLEGSAKLTIKITDYPNKPPRVLGPYIITPETLRVPFRCRGRQASFRLEGGGLGAAWRFGKMRINTRPDGMR